MAGTGAAALMFELYKTKAKPSIGLQREFCKNCVDGRIEK
jgi:hypothetical protein